MSCNGDCCVAFRVPFDLIDLARGDVGVKDSEEAIALADMLIPLTVEEANARQAEHVRGTLTGFTDADEGRLYACRHWDAETRLCGIYEDRPPSCSAFPYGRGCRYGCSCEGEVPDSAVII